MHLHFIDFKRLQFEQSDNSMTTSLWGLFERKSVCWGCCICQWRRCEAKSIYVSYDISIVQNIFTYVHYGGDGMYIIDGKENIANHRWTKIWLYNTHTQIWVRLPKKCLDHELTWSCSKAVATQAVRSCPPQFMDKTILGGKQIAKAWRRVVWHLGNVRMINSQ